MIMTLKPREREVASKNTFFTLAPKNSEEKM